METTKLSYCRYDAVFDIEYARGCLRVYIPTYDGYINYNIVHTVNERINADVWRIGQAYSCNDDLEILYPITPKGAEWDMAIKLQGRSDFIGGAAHGDEKYIDISMRLNGKYVDISSMDEVTPFDEILIFQSSIGYDPNDSQTKVLNHYKEYKISKDGISLKQKVEWLNDYALGSSYMAMMPPAKTVTDMFYTDIEPDAIPVKSSYTVNSARSAVVFGATSGFSFSMSVPQYPKMTGGDRFLMTDNNGGQYNKMYFVICDGVYVSKCDLWETATHYQIERKRIL